MIITGAGGFAAEVLDILYRQRVADIVFYDDVSAGGPELLFDRFPILRNAAEAVDYFKNVDNRFVLGTGVPAHRRLLSEKMTGLGGLLTSVVSEDARIGSFNNTILEGGSIMQGVIITNGITVGKGCLINWNTTIGHGTRIGNFCDISPGVHISGGCVIGNCCSLGANAVILPRIKIADQVIIGASGLVVSDITASGTYVGIPIKKIK
ncbi:MAG: hexapeptide transferase [Chitinophagaceae bacterium]|nr:hexapeptide transferase [Chitinophagaceae bacterium]